MPLRVIRLSYRYSLQHGKTSGIGIVLPFRLAQADMVDYKDERIDRVPADIILYALVAAGLVVWLRSILGTRHEDEPTHSNPFSSTQEEPDKAPAAYAPQGDETTFSLADRTQQLPRHVAIAEKAETGLAEIAKIMKGFDTVHFAEGAEGAFIMIVEAFAKGERNTLKDLLSEPVYKAFESVIAQREKEGQKIETEIHAVRKLDIQDAAVSDGKAYITVQFTADETYVTRDKDGTITSGDPERVSEMRDIWVFAKNLKSKDPVWELVSTRDGDDHNAPVPDAS